MNHRSVMLASAVGVVFGTSLQAGPALAHHSFAMFDRQKTQTIQGTVKDYQWANPHVWIDVLVNDPTTNKPMLVGVEAGSTFIEARMGWSRTSIKPGDKVSLVVNPLRNGSIGGSLVSGSVNGTAVGHSIDFKAQ